MHLNMIFFIFQKTFKTVDLFFNTCFMTNVANKARFNFCKDSRIVVEVKVDVLGESGRSNAPKVNGLKRHKVDGLKTMAWI